MYDPYAEACCRLAERFPTFRPLWHRLWRVALRAQSRGWPS